MSNRSKGNQLQITLRKAFEAARFRVETARPDLRWIRKKGSKAVTPIALAHDLFGVFDLIAVPLSGCRFSAIRMVQVTTAEHAAARRAKVVGEISTWSQEILTLVSPEIWAWHCGRRRKKKSGEGDILAQCWTIEDPDGNRIENYLEQAVLP